jgi:predicted nucleotidyltransferase
MLSKSEIIDVLRKETEWISEKYNFRFVYLAGSVAREEHHKWSDIDIFVSFPEFLEMSSEEKYNTLGDINLSFSDKLDKVVVKVLESLPMVVQFNVIKDGEILLDSEYRANFIEDLLRSYHDFNIYRGRLINSAMEEQYR